jgi:hypothetical protein
MNLVPSYGWVCRRERALTCVGVTASRLTVTWFAGAEGPVGGGRAFEPGPAAAAVHALVPRLTHAALHPGGGATGAAAAR